VSARNRNDGKRKYLPHPASDTGAMSNPPSAAAAAMGPPSVAAVARTTQAVVAHSAGPLGQTQAQGLKRAFEGM
jgi:hypothetical protein